MNFLPTDPLRRSAVFIAFLSLSGQYFVYTYIHAPATERAGERRARIARLEGWNRQSAADGAAGEGDLEDRVGHYAEHIAALERLIPTDGEVAVLLEAVSEYETRTGVEVTTMRPQPIERGEFYDRWSYELGVRGSYHAIGSFMAGIASLDRIVVPTAVTIIPAGESGLSGEDDGGAVVASLRIQSYASIPRSPATPGDQPEESGGAGP